MTTSDGSTLTETGGIEMTVIESGDSVEETYVVTDALLAAVLLAAAVPVHHTATDDGPWSASENVGRLGDEPTAAQLRAMYAWKSDDADDAKSKSNWKFPHHLVGGDGKVGAASLKACSSIIGALNGGRGGAKIPDAARAGVYAHAKAHLVDGGAKPEDVPKLMAVEIVEQLATTHAVATDTHSHPHAAYGSQGGDVMHDHPHDHADDSHHGHDHPVIAALVPMPLGLTSFVASATVSAPDADWSAPFDMRGSSWGIRQTVDTDETASWEVLAADGSVRWTRSSREEAMAEIAEQLASEVAQGDRPVLADTWRSEMAYEGVSTGDGRKIAPGAIEYRDCPLPLMLQTTTDVGHYGAVLAGAIQQTGKVGNVAVGTGCYDDTEAGRQFRDIVAARDRFGVSIDVAEAEGEPVCYETDEYGDCVNGEMVFSLIRVMGLTGTPFPAFENAYIENVAASTASTEPCVDCEDPIEPIILRGPIANIQDLKFADLTAATAPVAPPAAWFDNPGLDRPTPPTVTADGRVFGHIAGWKSCHTSYADRCVPPPHSQSGYAYFTTGAVTCDDGSTVRVGQLTMGCGHADESPTFGARRTKAHYDGGPGAVQMADVAVGEDAHGIWFAGALRPGVTDEQVREFQAQQLSGDWRTVQRGGGLELIAALSVPVPGFPIAASAAPDDLASMPTGRARFVEGRVEVLVAAGMVRRPAPWEPAMAALRDEITELRERVARSERVTEPLRPVAAERLVASMTPQDSD